MVFAKGAYNNNLQTIDGGVNYTVVVKADGSVAAWGDNDSGGCSVPAGLKVMLPIQ